MKTNRKKRHSEETLSRLRRERAAFGLVGLFVFLAVWEALGRVTNPLFLTPASSSILALVDLFTSGFIFKHLAASLRSIAVGYSMSIVLGIPLGILMGWYRKVNYTGDWLISSFYSVPKVAFIPLFVLWFGIRDIWHVVAVIFLASFFVIVVNSMQGVRAIDASLITVARSFGATDRQIFRSIVLPGSVPSIIAGLRIGIGLALISMVVAELYASTAGLGYILTWFAETYKTSALLGDIVLLAIIGVLMTEAVKVFEKRVEMWRVTPF